MNSVRKKRQKKGFPLRFSLFLLLLLGIFHGLPFPWDSLSLPSSPEAAIRQITSEPSSDAWKAEAPSSADTRLPPYEGKPWVVLRGNVPDFPEGEFSTTSFERYSELDALGRCGAAYANVGRDLMPTEKRGPIGQIKPSGWHTVRYDILDKKYLYNRCHLIGYQLTAENANPRNLITGTRYMNVEGMLPFENKVADYVKRTGNHVLYRATPVFEGNHLVAKGVELEAMSVEDRGTGIRFHVFCYNVQPGIVIDYATGESRIDTEKK